MSSPFDITPYEWFRRIFPARGMRDRFSSENIREDTRRGRREFRELFREFDDMRRDMETAFTEQVKDLETKIPKDLVREYQTPDGRKVREVGPVVYGYSMNIGPDGIPRIREFGNLKSPRREFFSEPTISAEREPLIDISSTEKEVKIVAELPGVGKEKIRIDAYDNYIEIKSEDPQRKYHKTIELPQPIDVNSGRSNYKNGILEITFNKIEQTKIKGRQINIE
jgi:HSP20 family protein